MASKHKFNLDPGMAAPAVMKELVAVAAQDAALSHTIYELRVRVERGLDNQKIRIAVLATILDASELVARLVRMEIAVEGEGDE